MVRDLSCDSDADHSSSDESGYSDEIDDDIAAELYSSIHHETITSSPETSQDDDLGSTSLHETSQNGDVLNVNSNTNGVKHFESHEESNCIDEVKHSNEVTPELFVSDLVIAGNLFISFETPPRRNMVNRQSSNQGEDPANSEINRKRKSDVAVDFLRNDQVGAASETNSNEVQFSNTNGSKKIKVDECSAGVNRHKTDNANAAEESSDTDSSIILIQDSVLKTNVEELVVLSSEDKSSSSMDESELQFSRIENSSFLSSPSTSSKDPWRINDDDLYRRKKGTSGRYHEKAALTCSNCNDKGHISKFCSREKPPVKCFICGGKHSFTACRNRVCYKCFCSGHDPKYCSQQFTGLCQHCKMIGHRIMECPDLWRRYHLTTSGKVWNGAVIKGRELVQNSPLYCFNCGALGHYGTECREPRMNRYTALPRWTSVISYLPPVVSIKKIVGNTRKSNSVYPKQQFPRHQEQQFSPCQSIPVFAEGCGRFNQPNFSPHGFPRASNFRYTERPMKKGKEKNKAITPFNGLKGNKNSNKNSCDFPRTPMQKVTELPRTPNTEQPVLKNKKSKNGRQEMLLRDRKRKEKREAKLHLKLGLPPTPQTPF